MTLFKQDLADVRAAPTPYLRGLLEASLGAVCLNRCEAWYMVLGRPGSFNTFGRQLRTVLHRPNPD